MEFIGAKDNRVVYSARHFEKHAPYQCRAILLLHADAGSLREYVDEDTYRVYFCGFAGDEIVFMGAKGLHYGYQENSSFYRIDEATGREVLFAEKSREHGQCCVHRFPLWPLSDGRRYVGGVYTAPRFTPTAF